MVHATCSMVHGTCSNCWQMKSTQIPKWLCFDLQVLGTKYKSRLLEVIDSRSALKTVLNGKFAYQLLILAIELMRGSSSWSSQLPDFLGGTCSCEGGCLKFDKGPWNDPEIMKVWPYSMTRVIFLLSVLTQLMCMLQNTKLLSCCQCIYPSYRKIDIYNGSSTLCSQSTSGKQCICRK